MDTTLEPRSRYTLVRSFEFRTDFEDETCTLVLDKAEDHRAGSRAVTLEILGVTELSIRRLGGGLSQICGLSSDDVGDRQIDRVRYRVFDAEHGAIDFMCRAFRAVREFTI